MRQHWPYMILWSCEGNVFNSYFQDEIYCYNISRTRNKYKLHQIPFLKRNIHMFRKTVKIVSCVILFCTFYLFPASSQANRLIRVGIFQNYPLVFQNEEGIPQGLYIDLIKEIATQEGWELPWLVEWTCNRRNFSGKPC